MQMLLKTINPLDKWHTGLALLLHLVSASGANVGITNPALSPQFLRGTHGLDVDNLATVAASERVKFLCNPGL